MFIKFFLLYLWACPDLVAFGRKGGFGRWGPCLIFTFSKIGKKGFLYGKFGRALIRLGESGYWRFRSPGFSLTFVKFYFIFVFVILGPPHEIFISGVRPQRNLASSHDFKTFENHWSRIFIILCIFLYRFSKIFFENIFEYI